MRQRERAIMNASTKNEKNEKNKTDKTDKTDANQRTD